jgi:hypothetical protein
MKKIFLFPPLPLPPKLKRKKTRHLECRLNLPVGCMKLVGTIFNLDSYPHYKLGYLLFIQLGG